MANNTKNTTNKTNTTTIVIDKKLIALFFATVGALLIFIGLFGDIMKEITRNGSLTAATVITNLEYIFKSGWDEIMELLDAGILTDSAASFNRVLLVIQIFSFVIAVLGVTTIILRSIYLIYKKQDIKLNKSLALLSIFGLQYAIISRFMFLSSVRQSQTGSSSLVYRCEIGWGAILIIIGFFIALLSILINESRTEGELLSQSNIVCKIGVIFGFFIALFGMTTLVSVKVEQSISETIMYRQSSTSTAFTFLTTLLRFSPQQASQLANFELSKGLTICSIVFSFIAFASFILTLYYFIKGNVVEDKKKLIIANSIYLVCFLIANILLNVASVKISTPLSSGTRTIAFGYTAIVGLILGSLMLIAGIISINIKGKTIKFVKSK